MALGLNANAYTTSDHTAYLFSGVDNFYPGLDELMDYVQHPYYTDENVEKERGIIGQEINRYNDEPFSKLYNNCMKCLYKNNTINIDTAGTVESISHITKETLYSCYNTFYHPSNTVMVISGDFEPEKIIDEVKKRLLPREPMSEIKRIYPEEPKEVNEKYKEQIMDVNMPIFMIGFKDDLEGDKLKEQIGIQIIFNSLLGKCSKAYQDMYSQGLLMSELELEYEYSRNYAHVIIAGESKDPKKVNDIVIKTLMNTELSEEDIKRSKRRIYGEYVQEYNDVEEIGRMFLQDAVKGENTINYLDRLEEIDYDYLENLRKRLFVDKKQVLSVVKGK
jgi:predicted Zn-dependent peptidase